MQAEHMQPPADLSDQSSLGQPNLAASLRRRDPAASPQGQCTATEILVLPTVVCSQVSCHLYVTTGLLPVSHATKLNQWYEGSKSFTLIGPRFPAATAHK